MNKSQTHGRSLSWRRNFIAAAVLLATLFLVYGNVLRWLVKIWIEDKEYSHGFLVPFVSLFFVWIRRDHIRGVVEHPSAVFGASIIFIAGMLLLAGRAGGLTLLEALSLLVVIPGIILMVAGWRTLRLLAFPVAYLQFMVPWTDELLDKIQWPFQMASASIGVSLMKLLDLPVYQENHYIFLPNVTLEVAKECSGLGFLVSIVALAIPLVYLTQRSWGRAAAVVSMSVPITLVTNGVRVGLVGWMAHYFGGSMAHGPFHLFQGWFVAQVGFALLFFLNWGITAIPGRMSVRLYQMEGEIPEEEFKVTGRRWTGRIVSVMVLLVAIGGYVTLLGLPRSVPLTVPLDNFPERLGEWSGHSSQWVRGGIYFPGVDTELERTYRNAEGREVHLYVGYFLSQRQGKSIVNYHAKPLLLGASVIETGLAVPSPQRIGRADVILESIPRRIHFWFHLDSGNFTNRYATKAYTVLNAVFRRRNNGTVLLVAVPNRQDSTGKRAERDVLSFIEVAAPYLAGILP